MRNIITIINKELRIYFISPMAYIVTAMFLLIMGFLFFNIVSFFSAQSLQFRGFRQTLPYVNIHEAIFMPTFHNISIVLLLIIPLITMRLFAEEKKLMTTELLFTSPLSVTEIIIGKYLSALIVFILMLVLTLPMPVFMEIYSSVEWRLLISSYTGIFFLGAIFLSVGLFGSSLTENQIIAAVISFGILLILWLLGFASAFTSSYPLLNDILSYLSIKEHLNNFLKGLLDTSDMFYFLSVIVFWLFSCHRVIDSHKWR
ncbi:MAG: ABC transporter permease subunit [Nitrospirota bacterium]